MQQTSADQVSAMVHGVNSQMGSDTVWLGKFVEALNEHWDTLDKQHEISQTLTGIQEGIGAFALGIQQKFGELSQKTFNDDELIRSSRRDAVALG